MSGSNPVNGHGQTPRAVRSFRAPRMAPFNVILVNPEDDATAYAEWAASCVVPPIVVAEKGGAIAPKELTPETLRTLFLARCDKLPDTIDPEAIATTEEMLSSWVETAPRKLGYQVGGHNSVTPNLLVLASAGYDDLVYGPFKDINRGIHLPQPLSTQIHSEQIKFPPKRAPLSLDTNQIGLVPTREVVRRNGESAGQGEKDPVAWTRRTSLELAERDR